jgi:hypothetical protein
MGAPDSPVRHRTITVHCPVRATSAQPLGFGGVDRWKRLSSSCTGQSGDLWLCCSDFGATLSLLWHFHKRPLVEQGAVAPLAHRTVRWIIAKRAAGNPRVASSRLYGPGAPDTVRCAKNQHTKVLLLQLNCVPNLIYFLVCVDPYAPVVHEF